MGHAAYGRPAWAVPPLAIDVGSGRGRREVLARVHVVDAQA